MNGPMESRSIGKLDTSPDSRMIIPISEEYFLSLKNRSEIQSPGNVPERSQNKRSPWEAFRCDEGKEFDNVSTREPENFYHNSA